MISGPPAAVDINTGNPMLLLSLLTLTPGYHTSLFVNIQYKSYSQSEKKLTLFPLSKQKQQEKTNKIFQKKSVLSEGEKLIMDNSILFNFLLRSSDRGLM